MAVDDPQREITMSVERLHELVYQAVGAGSVPFMRDNPGYVMPTEELVASTQRVMRQFGVEPIAGYDPPLPQPKPREASDMVSAQEISTYLDEVIRNWRRVRDGEVVLPTGLAKTLDAVARENTGDAAARLLASLYVDAFQSARVSLVGELLA